MLSRFQSAHLLAVLVMSAVTGPDPRPEKASLGFEPTSAAEACSVLSGPEGEQDVTSPVLIDAGPEMLLDAAPIDALLDCAPGRRLSVVVRLAPPVEWQREVDPYAAIGAWIADLEAFLQSRHARVKTWQLGRRPELQFDPESYIFLVEKVSTLLRSFDPEAALIVGPLGESAMPWMDRIEPRRLAPYIRGVALEDPVDLAVWLPRLARDYPASTVWLHGGSTSGDAETFLRRFHAARGAGVETFFVRAAANDPITGLAVNLARALPSRFVVDQEGDAGTEPLRQTAAGGAIEFADPLGPERAAITTGVWPGTLVLGSDPVRDVKAYDLVAGVPLGAWASRLQGEASPVTIAVAPLPAGPVLVRYVVMKGLRATPETVGVTDEYEMTAEEIIARHRAFAAAQARSLGNYEAKATMSFHYRAETLGESIDVASTNRFFWRDGVGEFQELQVYVNGAKWRGEKAPSLPFVSAEKVKEVPLEIRLDASYVYRLEGRDTVDGRPAWILDFEPVESERSLYSGRLWIDRETFARLKVHLVQHALKDPITSNTDDFDYGPIMAEGVEYWLPVRAYRQTVFTVLGRAVAVERRVTWEEFQVNSARFEQGREQAYAAGLPILREDAEGSTYLLKDADGFREVKTETLKNVAIFTGISVGSGGVGNPAAGINYFDFNWRNTGTQMDIAFAGALLNVAWTDPRLGQSRFELTLESRLTALPDRFKKVNETGRVHLEYLEVLEQRAWVTLAHPITTFQKAEVQLETAYDNYGFASDTETSFVVPATRPVVTGTARWRYTRAGYNADLWFSAGHRIGWEDWGQPFDPNAPIDPNAPVAPNGPIGSTLLGGGDRVGFQRWGISLLKSFYPAKFQKVSLGGALFAGRRLDRFSQYRFGDFRNARVRGYNSFDITFDRGATGQIAWQVTLPRGGVSLDLGLDGAVLENDTDFDERHYLIGAGIGVNTSGPKSTLLSFRVGRGLGSSIPDVSPSGVTVRFLLIKTFDHWPF